MRWLLLIALAGCTGYRTTEDSENLRADLDDGTLASRVRVALASAPETRNAAIEVACDDGIVYLRGRVSPATAAHARSIVANVGGVRRVVEMFNDRASTG